ncbi:juvenile hormone esterase [Amyelois transitella]|uniref:juvenile hormone esterase n=1 Tax=Amyelois transitella TaxID=680683 RepID=UPI0029904DB4|nr:juvenile hormone esterase [Amyelois transitella]XP_060803882.1 juvenile hormone esterase [Amyelois transitella]
MGCKKWLVLWSLWAARLVRQPTEPLQVSAGWLRGSIANDGSHEVYYGIPYATVRGRFQAPGPEPVWDDVYEAINENVRCRQRKNEKSDEMIGVDNCLIINVYKPLNVEDKPLAVMVFIHGGAFFQGSASPFMYGPQYLIKKGVILVTLTYRLNLQGFLCLRTKEAPGNAGMKDQVAALRWIQRNIKAFGGDPDNITIFGESAGAASVSFLVLSPMAKGLFHKAITQSGSAISSWAYQFKPVYMASLLAKTMGYETQDPHKLYNFFMQKSNTELIIPRVPRKKGDTVISEILYTPCVEDIIEGEEPFLTEIPYEILSKGNFNKVPMITGINDAEGILFAALENETTIAEINFVASLPKDLVFPSEEEKRKYGERLKSIYLGDEEITEKTVSGWITLGGDEYFTYPILEETNLIAKASDTPVYNYLFAYDGRRNLAKLFYNKFKNIRGASHADELFYIFSSHWIGSLMENKMIDTMTTLWTNFAKYGDPTPENTDPPVRWPRVNPADPQTLVINTTLSIRPMWGSEALQFWREMYSKYRRKER